MLCYCNTGRLFALWVCGLVKKLHQRRCRPPQTRCTCVCSSHLHSLIVEPHWICACDPQWGRSLHTSVITHKYAWVQVMFVQVCPSPSHHWLVADVWQLKPPAPSTEEGGAALLQTGALRWCQRPQLWSHLSTTLSPSTPQKNVKRACCWAEQPCGSAGLHSVLPAVSLVTMNLAAWTWSCGPFQPCVGPQSRAWHT